jgi:hypothetical protein
MSEGRIELAAPEGAPKAWTLLQRAIPDGERHNSLVRIAGWLRQFHPESVGAALLAAINDARCEPPLPEGEVRDISESVWRYPKPEKRGPVAVRFREDG